MICKNILILYMSCLTLHVQAQISKIYGYHQIVYGGAMQMNDNEEDKTSNNKTKQSLSDQYFIFAVTDKNKMMIPQQLWINQQLYNFTLDTIRLLPFILRSPGRNEGLSKDTLVKSATGCVIQLKDPIQANQQNITESIRKMVDEYELVLIYLYKGRVRKIFIRKMKQLPPVYNP